MRLYIAEKPSMAAELAKQLPGPHRRKEGCIITGEGVVTWAYGHILRQAEPDEYDEKYKRWRAEDLPILPPEWKVLVAESARTQFEIVKQLIGQADEIIHAGDPDREGQLLIDEILDYVGTDKPVRRLLLNALDEKSIRSALEKLRDNAEFLPLKRSALARQRADWLIGMNLSRAYTLASRRAGHRSVLPVGRVKTPTLALVVRREQELSVFTPVTYFTVKAEFEHTQGRFTAYWKPSEGQPGLDADGRLADADISKQLTAKLKEKPDGHISTYETTEKKEAHKLPFSLSALQVLAGKKFGYDPQTVLDVVQELYERKLTTYPRSDCEYLPESQQANAPAILAHLAESTQKQLAAWAQKADVSIRSRAWNDKKITAHHAIIPTTVACNYSHLSERQRYIYGLIARQYVAQFYPVHAFDQTRVEVAQAGEIFVANGRVVKDMGWKALFSSQDEKDDKEEEEGLLPVMAAGDAVKMIKSKAEKKSTKPPSRFTPSSLIAAMKEIHKYVKDPQRRQQLKDVAGIGTEATRATIIKELCDRGFLRQEGKRKQLVPTDSAYLLIEALPDDLTYPDSTAIWEQSLQQMAEGEDLLDSFLRSQQELTIRLCEQAGKQSMRLGEGYVCPRCGEGLLVQRNGRNGVFWGCTRYPACRGSSDDEDGKPKYYKNKGEKIEKKDKK